MLVLVPSQAHPPDNPHSPERSNTITVIICDDNSGGVQGISAGAVASADNILGRNWGNYMTLEGIMQQMVVDVQEFWNQSRFNSSRFSAYDSESLILGDFGKGKAYFFRLWSMNT